MMPGAVPLRGPPGQGPRGGGAAMRGPMGRGDYGKICLTLLSPMYTLIF